MMWIHGCDIDHKFQHKHHTYHGWFTDVENFVNFSVCSLVYKEVSVG